MALHSKPRRTALHRTAPGRYVPADGKPVKVSPAGYFILDVTDRKDNVWNRFGIYRVSESIDGKPVFEYRMDGFTFDVSRYCNAVSYYPMQLTARSEMIRLACLEGNRRDFYTVLDDNGLVRMADGGRHTVRIEAEDDCHNISAIEFEIEPGFADAEFTAAADDMRRRIAEGDPSLLGHRPHVPLHDTLRRHRGDDTRRLALRVRPVPRRPCRCGGPGRLDDHGHITRI